MAENTPTSNTPVSVSLEYPITTGAGVKVSDRARLEAGGPDVDSIARRATEAYLIQILRHGFFHVRGVLVGLCF